MQLAAVEAAIIAKVTGVPPNNSKNPQDSPSTRHFVPIVIGQARRSMKTARRIGVTWTGETIELPEAKSFNEQIRLFAAVREKPTEMDSLIFMTPTGLEVNEESYLNLQATSDIFYVYDVTQIADDGPIPDIFGSVPEISSIVIAELPSGASANLNMDDQISILESRLLVIIEAQEMLKEKAIEMIKAHQVLESGVLAALLNAERYHEKAIKDSLAVVEASRKTVSKINSLLSRCPLDFALMKRIPLHHSLAKGEQGLSLLDLKGMEWQEEFTKYELVQVTNLVDSKIETLLSRKPVRYEKSGHDRPSLENLDRSLREIRVALNSTVQAAADS
ncbi:hypothetical protein PSACC_01448 [Paramicrosporidium saccamoebae]|uniref:Uncharacterized protein n=1 Tax=Paramicrosporidium saccamoebae TaxID=1246581 RepID=A0A2H9TLW0_9FUNG|nr:hypothetical protein PSACC_01448 [Paramicrosporidium saccamoebae]